MFNNIHIDDFVNREIKYCVSELVQSLTANNEIHNALDYEEVIYSLWEGHPIEVDEDEEPEYAEVYEHWLVSEWLANKLREQDENVVELYGLNIWCRCSTGQAIKCDDVIQTIYNKYVNN